MSFSNEYNGPLWQIKAAFHQILITLNHCLVHWILPFQMQRGVKLTFLFINVSSLHSVRRISMYDSHISGDHTHHFWVTKMTKSILTQFDHVIVYVQIYPPKPSQVSCLLTLIGILQCSKNCYGFKVHLVSCCSFWNTALKSLSLSWFSCSLFLNIRQMLGDSSSYMAFKHAKHIRRSLQK